MIRILALFLLPTGSFACAVHEPLAIAQFAQDPVVVVGTVTDYRWDNWQATLTVTVAGTLAGRAPLTIPVFWSATMAEMAPEVWDRPDQVIIGLTPPGDDAFWHLSVPICGDAHLLPDTPENRAAVAAAIKVAGQG